MTKTRSENHPSKRKPANEPGNGAARGRLEIPRNVNQLEVSFGDRQVRLTNLNKLFWPELKITKRDLLQYYADVSSVLLPHVRDRAMVMKRYPNGAAGEFFFMKRAPSPRPEWIEICRIQHGSKMVDFPMVQDLASLLWVINLGCIDLNQWYGRCDDVDRPDYLHFDLDPVAGASFEQVRDIAMILRDALASLKMPCYAKTTGSRGIHVYVPIVRGPMQKEVWMFARELARVLQDAHPKLITTTYNVARRPKGSVLVDYNQNASGRTLASVYSVRPTATATVSTPVTWKEIEKGISIEDFRVDNVRGRIRRLGDLWQPLLDKRKRFRLDLYLK
ncbi:MAG TPA: non-homologous end-joining DNA ligase [Pyrinomonadaceae bacterium]|nr:non-homologous end-joining DNA ligase [Pyrinomonadaceae bacterium]